MMRGASDMNKLRIMLAEDHSMVRSGIKMLIDRQSDMEVVAEAQDGVEAIEAWKKHRPEVIVVDLNMPGLGGIPAVEELRRMRCDAKILALTMYEDAAYLRQFLNAGGNGYVLKKAVADTLITAIRSVRDGKMYVSPSLAGGAFNDDFPPPRRGGKEFAPRKLSAREQEVLSLIALGNTGREIARRLHISEKTVETHRAHVGEKLNVRTRADLVRYAIEHGLLKG